MRCWVLVDFGGPSAFWKKLRILLFRLTGAFFDEDDVSDERGFPPVPERKYGEVEAFMVEKDCCFKTSRDEDGRGRWWASD